MQLLAQRSIIQVYNVNIARTGRVVGPSAHVYSYEDTPIWVYVNPYQSGINYV